MFFIALISVSLIIFVSILDDKFYRIPFVILVINAIGFLVYIPFYEKYILVDWFKYLFIIHSGVNILFTIIMVYLYFRKTMFFKNHYNIFIKSIKQTKWNVFYVVDKKNRIKQMSEPVLEELGFTLEQVLNKPFFEVINKAVRITTFDDVDTNNMSVETYYDNYLKLVNKKSIEQHTFVFQNYQGKSVFMSLVEQPIYIMGKYKGRVTIGEKQSDFNLVGIERELKQANQDYESLRLKYLATLELADSALYFIDLDERYLWGSEKFVEMTKLPNAQINFEAYQDYIYKDDLNSYLGSLSSLTIRKQTFKLKYRLLINGKYVWVTDTGKRLFEDKSSNIILGVLDVVEATGYARTGLEDMDSLKTENELYHHLSVLFNQNRVFELALFDLSNIPKINQEYGRDIGNMLINEYVKKLKNSFMSESSDIFRISGLVFAITIVDPRKMELLRTGVLSNNKFLNIKMNYGTLNPEIEVILGVASSHKDAKDAETLFDLAYKALGLARHKDFISNACYYSDIRG